MYQKAYGIIETLAPLHIGASAGEENGNLNLIFRDQFTQTGIIPGSSIRGRFRADMRSLFGKPLTNIWYGHESKTDQLESEVENSAGGEPENIEEQKSKSETTEGLVKFEYASLVWMPVFCPGQPIVWVTCPRLLKRYQQITESPKNDKEELLTVPKPTGDPKYHPVKLRQDYNRLFFNLGFLDNLRNTPELVQWVPPGNKIQPDNLVVVEDADISLIHDMALYRQTRTKLNESVKTVDNFFGFEALPEDSILIFPIAIKESLPEFAKTALAELQHPEKWRPFGTDAPNKALLARNLYFGGLESIGCGRCRVSLGGEYFSEPRVGE